MRTLENTIRERGSTALYALVSVDTVYTDVMVDMVDTVDAVYTIQTALHCFQTVSCVPLYIVRNG